MNQQMSIGNLKKPVERDTAGSAFRDHTNSYVRVTQVEDPLLRPPL